MLVIFVSFTYFQPTDDIPKVRPLVVRLKWKPDASVPVILDDSIKEKKDTKIDYKKMSLNNLRDIIVSKKLATDPSKLKKNDMLKLLGSEW